VQSGSMGKSGAQLAIVKPRPSIEIVVMRVVTRCATPEAFITAFHRFCTVSTCFIPSTTMRTTGIETGFSIRLADGTPMLRGLCVIRESWATADNPYLRPGVLIGIRQFTAESKPVFERLLLAAEDHTRETVQMAPLFPDPTPGSALVLPANPLAELDDKALAAFVNCSVYEDEDQDTTRPIAVPTAPMLVPLPPILPETVASAAPTPVDDSPTEPTRAPIATLLGVAPIAAVPVAIIVSPAPRIELPVRRTWWRRALDSLRMIASRLRGRSRSHRSTKKRTRFPRLTGRS
jgi:hypothetical protein